MFVGSLIKIKKLKLYFNKIKDVKYINKIKIMFSQKYKYKVDILNKILKGRSRNSKDINII